MTQTTQRITPFKRFHSLQNATSQAKGPLPLEGHNVTSVKTESDFPEPCRRRLPRYPGPGVARADAGGWSPDIKFKIVPSRIGGPGARRGLTTFSCAQPAES